MIGLILLYFIGKAYYDLAGLYQKNKWLFAILGVISYYAGTAIGGVIIGILSEVIPGFSMEGIPDIALGLMALPVGILACWGFYKILEKQWSKQPSAPYSDEVLDSELK